jgi:ATP-dependent Clp protease ATP-binding subunit ClpA
MIERFTDRAKQTLEAAEDEARALRHGYVGTEHLLLGLAHGEGIAAKVLGNLGVSADRVRTAVAFVVGRGDASPEGDRALTPRAQRVVDLAAEESTALHHSHVGTEHLLLALLRGDDREVQESVAFRVLGSLGIERDQVRRQITQVLAGAGGGAQRRDHVVTCRVDDRTLRALDALVEAGVHATRSEAAARLIAAGLQANQALVERVFSAVDEIRRVRAETQAIAQQWQADVVEPLPGNVPSTEVVRPGPDASY